MDINKINENTTLLFRRMQLLESRVNALQADLDEFKNDMKECIYRVEKRLYRSKKNLTIAEASEYTGFSAHTIYQLTSSHKIKFFKPNGKTIFIPKKDLDNWMATNLQSIQEHFDDLKQ